MIRKEEEDEEFRKKLQNPLKPINNTEASPIVEGYLKKLNSGELKSEATLKKEKEAAENKNKKYTLFCPHCRRPSLRITAQRTYACFHCGLTTNSPLRMAE